MDSIQEEFERKYKESKKNLEKRILLDQLDKAFRSYNNSEAVKKVYHSIINEEDHEKNKEIIEMAYAKIKALIEKE